MKRLLALLLLASWPAAAQVKITSAPCKMTDGSCATGGLALSCQAGIGDGLNVIAAGTYLQTTCVNTSGKTWTITGAKCYSDNSGTSTLNVTNGSAQGLLTGAITCSAAFAAGTQSATVTIAPNDYLKFTFVSDGASKQSLWVVTGTYQ